MNIFKLDTSFADILPQIRLDLASYIELADTFGNDTQRIMIVYPFAAEHRAKDCRPWMYDSVVESDDYTSYLMKTYQGKPVVVIVHKEHVKGTIHNSVNELARRIREEIQNHDLTNMQIAISFKTPGLLLKFHTDDVLEWMNNAVRYHCIIDSNESNWLEDTHDKFHVGEGEIWRMDTAMTHRAGNDHDTDRAMHLIIDFVS